MRKVPGGNGAGALTRQQQLEEAALNAGTHTQVALQVVLVGGNQFPKGTLPGLVILNANGQATGLVARLVQSSNQGAVYYMILKNGTRYGFQWMYYLGQKETFGWVNVPGNAGRHMVATIQYRPATTPAPRANPGGNGYVPPQSDKSWTPPQAGTPYQPPTTGTPYQAPTAQPANSNGPPKKCNPNIPRYSQPNCVP